MTLTTALQSKTIANPAAPTSPAIDRPITLEARLQVALEHARRLTAMYGTESREVAMAWDTVEDLWTAQRRQKAQTPFERYCETYPDAPEARIYEV